MSLSLSQTLITGVYRTGTEFITQLLSGHPDLSATMYHVNALRFVLNRFDPLAENLDRAVAETAERLAERYEIALDRAAIAAEIRARGVSVGTFYDVLMSTLWLAGTPKHHWLEKCQLVWREIPDFVSMMPNGRAVLILRDPRSVLASFKKYTYAPAPAYLGAVFNCLDAMKAAMDLPARLGADKVLVVRYEDAAADPDGTARGIFRFIGLDPALASFDRSGWKNEKGEPWQANSSFHAGAGFDVQESIARWRKNLEPWEIALTEFVCGGVMESFGYQPSGTPQDWPQALRAILGDETMTHHLRRFLVTGDGIQAFPTDPLVRANWEENIKAG